MLAAAELRSAALRGDVIVTAVADEEFASIGTEAVVGERCRADAAIVTEPTELRIAVAHRASSHLEVETHGRAAHGSRPDSGSTRSRRWGACSSASRSSTARLRADPRTRCSERLASTPR